MIYLSCPKCRKQLHAPDEKAGVNISCPGCGQQVIIPPASNKTVMGIALTPPQPDPGLLNKTLLGTALPTPQQPAKSASLDKTMLGTAIPPSMAGPASGTPNKNCGPRPISAAAPPKNPSTVGKTPAKGERIRRPLLVAAALLLPILGLAGAVAFGLISQKNQTPVNETERQVAESNPPPLPHVHVSQKSEGAKATIPTKQKKTEPEPKVVPKVKPEPKIEPKSDPDPKPEPKPQPNPDPKPLPKPEQKGDPKAQLEELVKNLKDKDPIIRLKAVRTLEKLGPAAKPVLPALEEAAKDEDELVQAAARRAIQIIGKTAPEGLALWLKQLEDKDPLVRLKAAQAIGKLGNRGKKAIPALKEASKDEDEDVRAVAKKSLDNIQKAIAEANRPALAEITKGLKSKRMGDRLKAADELAKLGDDGREATRTLIESMMGATQANAGRFLDALEKIHPELHKPVVALLVDNNYTNKTKAIVSIASLGDEGKAAVPILVGIFQVNVPKLTNKGSKKAMMRTGIESLACYALHAINEVAPEDKAVSQGVLILLTCYCPPNARKNVYLSELPAYNQGPTTSRQFALDLAKKAKLEPKYLIRPMLQWIAEGYDPLTAIEELGNIGPEAKAALSTLSKLKLSKNQQVREAAKAAIDKIKAN